MLPISLSFFCVALVYSMVGFAGGSSYTAILALSSMPYELIPVVSLCCNLTVSSGGVYHYYKNGMINRKLTSAFVLSSIPLSFVGGYLRISEVVFFLLLAFSLIVTGLSLLVKKGLGTEDLRNLSFPKASFIGGSLGFLAGLVGIGGGIFLSPLMIRFRWATAREAASTASVFIFLNSISGLLGQLIKGVYKEFPMQYLVLLATVFCGGQIGSRISSNRRYPDRYIRLLTGVLILVVGLRVLWDKGLS